jgi:hypothetical protein
MLMILVGCDTGNPMQFEGKVAPGLGERGRPSETLEALRGSALDLDLPATWAQLVEGRDDYAPDRSVSR